MGSWVSPARVGLPRKDPTIHTGLIIPGSWSPQEQGMTPGTPPPLPQDGMPRSLGICEKLFLRWQMPLDLLALPDLNNNKDYI